MARNGCCNGRLTDPVVLLNHSSPCPKYAIPGMASTITITISDTLRSSIVRKELQYQLKWTAHMI
jgi:hypothetical protein